MTIPGWRRATDAYAEFLVECDDVSPERLRQELMAEYCRLFVGPGKLRCPPFESVYRDGGTVMGPSTHAVLQCYQEAGFQPAGPREPPDHMASELQFMSHLCRQEGDWWRTANMGGVTSVLSREDRFHQEHLSRWAEAFCSLLSRSTRSAFYQAVAALLSSWLAADATVPSAWLLILQGGSPAASAANLSGGPLPQPEGWGMSMSA